MSSYFKELQSERMTTMNSTWPRDDHFRIGVEGDIRWGSHGKYERKRPGKQFECESLVLRLDKRAATTLMAQLAIYVAEQEHKS